jgi:hypothetical protein
MVTYLYIWGGGGKKYENEAEKKDEHEAEKKDEKKDENEAENEKKMR